VNNYKNNARFAGVMFLTAMVASLVGGTMIATDEKIMVVFGIILELINALAVIGIIAALWNPLKKEYPSMTVGYLGVRIIEVIFCIAAAFIPVVVLNLGNNASQFMVLLNTTRDVIVAFAVPCFFGIGGLLFYIMLYRSRLVPRYISVWGFAATIGIILVMFVSVTAIKPILGLPIIINEIYLGIYLIVKGFKDEIK